MRIISLVLLACLAAGGAAMVAPEYRQDCLVDLQCKLQAGEYCFCLRSPNQQLGKCYCNMDPKFALCSKDSDCKGVGRPRQLCSCDSAAGRCKCLDPLY